MEHTLLDRSRYNLELVNGWFVAADSKTSASCGIVSVAVAVLVYVAENLLSKLLTENGIDGNWKMLFMFSAISAVLTFILSVFFHIWALSPSFLSESNNKTNTMKPIIFFEDIREFKNVTEYIEVAKRTTEDEYTEEIFREVYYNATICSKKCIDSKWAFGFPFFQLY